MRRVVSALVLATALVTAGCDTTPPSGKNLPTEALDEAIARAIGDPTTCVLLVDRASGKQVYRYGAHSNCVRKLPACDGPALISAVDTIPFATAGRTASCSSIADNSRSVGWTAGQVPGSRPLNYVAMMEGARALPGVEMKSRLESALSRAGL